MLKKQGYFGLQGDGPPCRRGPLVPTKDGEGVRGGDGSVLALPTSFLTFPCSFLLNFYSALFLAFALALLLREWAYAHPRERLARMLG